MAIILVADDHSRVRELVSEMLRSSDHAALVAEDGHDVLQLLDTVHVDLLITDMLMPNMDGVELLMAVKERHPALKVLAISSGGTVGGAYMLSVAKALGADATLLKPLRLAPFLEAVEQLLAAEDCTLQSIQAVAS